MKLIENGRQVEYIDVDSDRVPCALLVKLTDRTYRLTFRYNEEGDFFTVDLETSSGGSYSPLVFGEVLRYGKPLFEAFNDERYPLPVICPVCLTGDDIDAITWDNFGQQVRLYLFDRVGGGS
ncbi:phage baseplate plug protein [uncultured Dysosmobacter sp.]|uniref:phage baseplate plug family protein n=1 Tax=uncultured Dysosmobacter sp. TaxID=2591384 RepID=UPI00262D9433|nr:hypothetical protein [uncultured Dysosmobacter sp.]